ncbi:hypothetical protein CN980_29020 [Bacillus cereus]|uniref:Uncharacterized protein n=1 Tax=Bacillus cereus TaxID=1396 RepID=A0A9X7C5Q5_BACCE|nr:hypothetical protein CN980_29020 [Bacillus cereus]
MLLEEITPQNIAIKIAAQVPMDIEIPPSNKMNFFYILTLLNVLLLINLNITQTRCYETKQNSYLNRKRAPGKALFD